MTFILCYAYWISIHCFREFWSFSKKSIVDKDNGFNKVTLGEFDSAYNLTYSIFGFLSGWISDKYSKKLILIISMAIQAICYFTLFLLGRSESLTEAFYFIVFFTIGIT